MHTYQSELKKLNLRSRNKVRTILSYERDDAVRLLNQLRESCSGGELAQIDKVLRSHRPSTYPLIPPLFPDRPQTSEDFHRLSTIKLHKQVRIIEEHTKCNLENLNGAISAISSISSAIIERRLPEAAERLVLAYDNYGYSHTLLRKAALIRALDEDVCVYQNLEEILTTAGLPQNNIIVTSLVQCYQEEQDFLSMKRSIMNISRKGKLNKFTRDICRLPFHPFAFDENDLSELLQSSLQSSLLDALITIKVNKRTLGGISQYPSIQCILQKFDDLSPHLDSIATLYPDSDQDCEHIFYKHSSAWLEVDDVIHYRNLQDHFYDFPESSYFVLNEQIIASIFNWAGAVSLNKLASHEDFTAHGFTHLKSLEQKGMVTRSALFNYCLHTTNGFTEISEDRLIDLMGRTQDLPKTINPEFATNLAKISVSNFSKLILYILIAKKSRNERDDHLLRRVLQDIVKNHFESDIVSLFSYLSTRSDAIAKYAYEVCTEDFIAKLFYIIKSSSDITETRANLHKWMGHYTGEKTYLDRARTLLIDHQLNKVRNEIDDNRIYVDAARFHEWIDDEILGELNPILSGLGHKNALLDDSDPILLVLIERCYATFCSNKIFGIASYLGRRIRHGTFKGHLLSIVSYLERNSRYTTLLADQQVSQNWKDWKTSYEAQIDEIIRERLHVESSTKRDGLLKPNLSNPIKQDILTACAKNLARDFLESKTTLTASHVIAEYCWRLAEVDLKAFNAYLKNQRRILINQECLSVLRSSTPLRHSLLAHEFLRELIRIIDEKLLGMYTWFKRPANVSPKASLALLYKAVVEEVKESFPEINATADLDPDSDIELFGGAYHVLYDSFYVVVYNAAKHGKKGGIIHPKFSIGYAEDQLTSLVIVEISSEIKDDQLENEVIEKLKISPGDDIENAQLYENRSGIPKLYHLGQSDSNFRILKIECQNRKVIIRIAYELEH